MSLHIILPLLCCDNMLIIIPFFWSPKNDKVSYLQTNITSFEVVQSLGREHATYSYVPTCTNSKTLEKYSLFPVLSFKCRGKCLSPQTLQDNKNECSKYLLHIKCLWSLMFLPSLTFSWIELIKQLPCIWALFRQMGARGHEIESLLRSP